MISVAKTVAKSVAGSTGTLLKQTVLFSADFESGLVGSMVAGDSTATYTLNIDGAIDGAADAAIEVTSPGSLSYRPSLNFNTIRGSSKKCFIEFQYKVITGQVYFNVFALGGQFVAYKAYTESGYVKSELITPVNTNTIIAFYFNGQNEFKIQLDKIRFVEVG